MRVRLAGCVVAAAIVAALPASASADVFCDYVDAEPAGPAGNILAITASGQVDIFEDIEPEGEETDEDDVEEENLFEAAASVATRSDGSIAVNAPGRTPVACAGGEPTLTNVDHVRIVTDLSGFVVVDLVAGPLAPGATDEGDGSSEIEIAVAGTFGNVLVRGGTRPDRFTVSWAQRNGRLGANLNPRQDDDLDLTASEYTALGFAGGEGDDRFFVEPASPRAADEFEGYLFILGGPGDDAILGGLGRYGELEGGKGDDLVRAGAAGGELMGGPGNDELHAGPGGADLEGGDGDDRLVGGAADDILEGERGRDRLLGRGGNDTIRAKDGDRDAIDCGPGRDRVLGADDQDRRQRCERRGRRGFGFPPGVIVDELLRPGE